MKTRFLHYLHFSRNERLGVFALLILCIGVFSTPAVLQWLRPKTITDFSEFRLAMQTFHQSTLAEPISAQSFDFDPNEATEADFKRLGLSEKVAHNICHYREKGGSFKKPEDFQKIWGLEPKDYARLLPYIRISMAKAGEEAPHHTKMAVEAFPFDPNTATESDFSRLGLSDRTIKSLINYRLKGGVFRKKEDFGKIFTLSEADYLRLEPLIAFSNADVAASGIRPNTYASGSGGNFKSWAPKGPVDINQAGVEAWMSLPLIGEKRAQQIVHFREKLGGFLSIDQLREMYNLPDSVFQLIRPQLVLESTPIHKINLNTVSVVELDAHPYISKKQADLIIAYRLQHGKFGTPTEVLNIKAFTDKTWWDKVSPYLAVE